MSLCAESNIHLLQEAISNRLLLIPIKAESSSEPMVLEPEFFDTQV